MGQVPQQQLWSFRLGFSASPSLSTRGMHGLTLQEKRWDTAGGSLGLGRPAAEPATLCGLLTPPGPHSWPAYPRAGPHAASQPPTTPALPTPSPLSWVIWTHPFFLCFQLG